MGRPRRSDVEEALARVEEFLRQWAIAKSKFDDVYGVHFDENAEMAHLYASDLRLITGALRHG